MGFDNLGPAWASIKRREVKGVACNQSSCGCSTCPLGPNGSRACLGPNKRCDARNCDRECLGCRAVCNRRPDKATVLRTIGGTVEFDDIRWEPWSVPSPPAMFQLNTPLKLSSVARGFIINIRKLIYIDVAKGASGNWSPQLDLKARFGIPRDSILAINFCAPDEVVDYLGVDIEETADRIAGFKSDFVFATNFSVYGNYPAFDSHVNLRRRFLSLDAFQRRGLKVVPSVAWLEYRQRDRVIAWLERNEVTAVMRNLQTFAAASETEQWWTVVQDLAYLRKRLPKATIFLVGCSSPNRIKTVLEQVEGPLVFIDSKAQRLAEFHKTVLGVEDRGTEVPRLIERNFETVLGWATGGRHGGTGQSSGRESPGDRVPQ
jgi:hypothetical protein